MKRFYSFALIVVFLSALLSGCAEEESEIEIQYADTTLGIDYSKYEGVELSVYNWGYYISDGSDGSIDVNEEFERLTGIRIVYDNYDSNESLYAKLSGGGADYDVIIPSDYMIGRLIQEGMLAELVAYVLEGQFEATAKLLSGVTDDKKRRLYSIPGAVPENYPELTGCIFLDAPIVNYCAQGSCRIGSTNGVWEREVLQTYPGLKHYQLASFSENPVHMVELLVKNEIPVLMCWGEEDATVCYADHGALLEEAYAGTGLMTVLSVPFRGHHPHGLLGDNGKLADLIDALWK